MSYEQLNSLITVPVMLSWLAMILAPRWSVTRRFLESDMVPLVCGVIYLSIAVRYVPGWFSAFRSLATTAELLAHPDVFFIGWLHYLAFDLFVGRSLLADSQRRGVPHLLVVPCLFLTFMFGPGGYVAYAVVRLLTRRYSGAIHPLPVQAPESPMAG